MRPMRNISFTVLALVLGLPPAGQAAEPLMMPSHAQVGAEACLASAAWFEANAPEADFNKFGPNSTNCEFHQWAVQEFLYLMQLENERARFLNMASPHALFLYKGDQPKPYPGGRDTQFKLGAGMASLRSSQGESNAAPSVVFLPRTLKTENTTFVDHQQAGSNAVLIDQKGQIVYYTSQINRVYYDFILGRRYYRKEAYADIPEGTTFPVGTLELKSSWRIAEMKGKSYINKDKDGQYPYYTVVANLCEDSGCKSPVTATMALVGFHVVGRVKNHPEMVWATFEHNKNAPDCRDTPRSGDYSFYPTGKNCGKAPFWESCNQIPKPDSKTPSDVCRAYPYGEIEPVDQRQRDNTANIKSINDSYAMLAREKAPVWGNYFYAGAVWVEQVPDEQPAKLINLAAANIRGSKKAANTSLESFTQEKNCLHCHTYQPAQLSGKCFPSGNKNLYLSHLISLICEQKP